MHLRRSKTILLGFALVGSLGCNSEPGPAVATGEDTSENPPRMWHTVIKNPPSIEFTVDNHRSKSDLLFTKRIGFVHANNMKANSDIDHLIDEGSKSQLKPLKASDIVTVKAGDRYVFTVPCLKKEFQNIKKYDELGVVIDPITIESFAVSERAKVKAFSSKFTKGFKSGIISGDLKDPAKSH